jgi:heat shock protein HtpX
MFQTFKLVLLLSVLTGLLIAVGNLIGGTIGMLVALIIAAIANFSAYWFSDRIVLSMYKAREIPYEEAPWLHDMVEELARRADIPKPKLYLIPAEHPNAFATGRNPKHSAVALTWGLFEILNDDELKGVIAHELSHIKNRDILIASIVATIAGAISLLVNLVKWIFLLGWRFRSDDEDGEGIAELVGALLIIIFVPIIATLIQLAISRSREYLADETGAKICGCPIDLANALIKIENSASQIPLNANPATAHLFIKNPLKGIMNIFSTHPSTEKRVEKLCKLAEKMGQQCG